jgi:hypothetical protein
MVDVVNPHNSAAMFDEVSGARIVNNGRGIVGDTNEERTQDVKCAEEEDSI